MSRRSHTGRLLLHQCETNNEAPILGVDVIVENVEQDLQETKEFELATSARRDYRNRLKRIIKYQEINFLAYVVVGVRNVSEDDQKKRALYYFDRVFKQDIICTSLNIILFLKFLIFKKDLRDGKVMSFNNICKYKDAIIQSYKIAK